MVVSVPLMKLEIKFGDFHLLYIVCWFVSQSLLICLILLY